MNLDTDDLIGQPWQLGGRGEPGYDCGGIVREVLARLGVSPPEFPAGSRRDPIASVEEFGEAWEKLGDTPLAACKLGDVVVTDPSCKGMSVHLSVVVDERPRRLITAASPGGVRRAPGISEAETIGAYRLRALNGRVEL